MSKLTKKLSVTLRIYVRTKPNYSKASLLKLVLNIFVVDWNNFKWVSLGLNIKNHIAKNISTIRQLRLFLVRLGWDKIRAY